MKKLQKMKNLKCYLTVELFDSRTKQVHTSYILDEINNIYCFSMNQTNCNWLMMSFLNPFSESSLHKVLI